VRADWGGKSESAFFLIAREGVEQSRLQRSMMGSAGGRCPVVEKCHVAVALAKTGDIERNQDFDDDQIRCLYSWDGGGPRSARLSLPLSHLQTRRMAVTDLQCPSTHRTLPQRLTPPPPLAVLCCL
jgi:hypothetical protein